MANFVTNISKYLRNEVSLGFLVSQNCFLARIFQNLPTKCLTFCTSFFLSAKRKTKINKIMKAKIELQKVKLPAYYSSYRIHEDTQLLT